MKDTEFERKQTFGDFRKEVETKMNGVRPTKEFEHFLINAFVNGETAGQALEKFCNKQH